MSGRCAAPPVLRDGAGPGRTSRAAAQPAAPNAVDTWVKAVVYAWMPSER